MTNKEAIYIINNRLNTYYCTDEDLQALDLAIKALEERPQGEWEESHILSCGNILQMGMDVVEHKCKNCGRWSIKWVRAIPDNFCSHCGAKMEGGTE